MGDVSFDERTGVPQQPVRDATADIEAESRRDAPVDAVEPLVAPEPAVLEPKVLEPAILEPVTERDPPGGAAHILPAVPNAAVPAELDNAVSTSASLLGSVAGGFGLAAIAGGGLVILGLGSALGAWYSVALANSYLGRR